MKSVSYFSISLLLLAQFPLYLAYGYECPPDIGITYLPNPHDCRKFVVCKRTPDILDMTWKRCIENYCFDAKINGCSPAEDMIDECHEGDLTEKYFPDCNNCTKFYQCANGKKVQMTCPNNLWFNFAENKCDHIRNIPVQHGCGDIRCTEGANRKKFEVEKDDKKFLWCLDGRAYIYQCCKPEEKCHFDVENQQCVTDASVLDNFIKKGSYSDNYDDVVTTQSICRNAPKLPQSL